MGDANPVSPVSPINPVNPVKENPSSENQNQHPHPALFLDSNADRDQHLRARKNLTIADVMPEASIYYLSDSEFDEGFLASYEHTEDLKEIILQTLSDSATDPYVGRETNAMLMGKVMESMQTLGHFVPKGWYPVMKELRKKSAVRVCRSSNLRAWLAVHSLGSCDLVIALVSFLVTEVIAFRLSSGGRSRNLIPAIPNGISDTCRTSMREWDRRTEIGTSP